MKRAFHLLDTANNMTVTKSALRRVLTTFLLPLTREQFQDVLAQVSGEGHLEPPGTRRGDAGEDRACDLAWLSHAVPRRVSLVTVQ